MKILTRAKKDAFMLFLGAHTCLTDAMEAELREANLVSLAVYDVLVTLEMAEGETMRMSELASRVLYSRSGLTRLVDRLESSGYVTRNRCPDDRRGFLCTLTDKGRKAREEAWPVVSRCMTDFFARHLSKEETEVVSSVMKKIIAAVSESDSSEMCRKVQTKEATEDE